MHALPDQVFDIVLALVVGAAAVSFTLLATILAVTQHMARLQRGLDRLKERVDEEGLLHRGLIGLEHRLVPVERLGERWKWKKDVRLNRWAEHIPLSADVMTLLRPIYLWIGLNGLQPHPSDKPIIVAQSLGIFLLCYALAIFTNWRRSTRLAPGLSMIVIGGLTWLASVDPTSTWHPAIDGSMGLIAWVFDLLDGPKAHFDAQRRGHPTRYGKYLDPIVDVLCFTMVAAGLWDHYPWLAAISFTVGIGGRIGFSLAYFGLHRWRPRRLPGLLPESMAGKYKTAFLAASCVLVMFHPTSPFVLATATSLLLLATALELISLVQQTKRAARCWRSPELLLVPTARAVNE